MVEASISRHAAMRAAMAIEPHSVALLYPATQPCVRIAEKMDAVIWMRLLVAVAETWSYRPAASARETSLAQCGVLARRFAVAAEGD